MPPDSSSNSKCVRWAEQQKRKMSKIGTQKFWMRHLPVIGFLTKGYSFDDLLSDAVAGITVGLTFIPSSMASAVLTGIPPQYGLYSSLASYFMYAILGSERCVVIGPTVLTAMLCRPFVDTFGVQVAFTLAFYSGLLVAALGLMNMSFVVHFISAPVLDGFLSAAAISAISSQIAPLLGFPSGGSTFVSYWINIVKKLQEYGPSLWDSVLGVSCVMVLVGLQLLRRFTEIPEGKTVSTLEKVSRGVLKYVILGRTAIVVLISTVIITLVTSDGGIPPVKVAGNIADGLPRFIPPPLTLQYNNETMGFVDTVSALATAVTIPLIIIMESSAAAKAFAAGQSVDAVQELIAVGAVNFVASFMQAMPCAASVMRTTINYNAGVHTPLGAFFSGTLVLLSLVLFSEAMSYMPDAALAAVIITAVYFLIQIHHHTRLFWKTNNKSDLIPLWVTFLSCLILGLDYGMIFGIGINAMLLLSHVAKPKVHLTQLVIKGRRVLLAKPDRSISYPGAEQVRRAILKPARQLDAGLLVVLDGKHIAKIDYTAIKSITSMKRELELKKQDVIFWNWNENLIMKFNNLEVFRNGEDLERIISSEFVVTTTHETEQQSVDNDSDAESTSSHHSATIIRDLP